MDKRVVIIGSGNVAESLCRWIILSGNELTGICSRNGERARELAEKNGTVSYTDITAIPYAEIYIISVSDNAIQTVSEQLNAGESVVVHTSGGCGIDELSSNIANRGVLYPMQTFTSGRELDFNKIPLFIEADNDRTYKVIRELATDMSSHVFDSDTDMRRGLHISAVFACNFINHLYSVGQSMVKGMGLPAEILRPLVKETVNKMLDAEDPFAVQTGPAIREDRNTIDYHIKMIEDTNYPLKIYQLLTDSIINYKLNGKL
ncbi:MAG: DUF2520 domain-containing protein [Rikenellaceae bacterium]|nr:DUF2520 domain-containing protein [Rikenellaceae bacterium]